MARRARISFTPAEMAKALIEEFTIRLESGDGAEMLTIVVMDEQDLAEWIEGWFKLRLVDDDAKVV